MSNSRMKVTSAIAATLVAGAAAMPAQAAENEWNVEVMPYLWAAGVKGDLNVGGRDIEVDSSFSDLLDMMEIGGGLLMRAEREQWVLWTQVSSLYIACILAAAAPAFRDCDMPLRAAIVLTAALPDERGFPLQLVARSRYGYKWAKWITDIEVGDSEVRGYRESRGYSNSARVGELAFG